MKRLAVIGGGISGLTATYAIEKLRKKGAELNYVLFEAGPRFGGVVQTDRTNDFVVEAGPDSFLTEKPWASDLCRELGLADQLISSNDAERRTYILVGSRLLPLPDGLMFMVPTNLSATFFSSLFSWPTKLRIIREWFYRASPEVPESSVAEFVERHYGREMVERIADPLLAGVYGGTADELSVTSVLPRFAEIEARQGSLGRALLASRKLQAAPARPLFTSLRDGVQTMTDALLKQIPEFACRKNTAVEAVAPESGKWLVVSRGRTEEFDGIIVATPAYAAAGLLRASIPQVFDELGDIHYSSSVTVALAYGEATRASMPAGFGFLAPWTEGKRIRACTFVHNKFAGRVPEKHGLLRCFLGGTRDEGILQSPDQEIDTMVRRELQEILGITAEPRFVKIYRWPKAMAQYNLGHQARVERIRQLVSATPGLALAGNAYSGIGLPDCVRSGSEAVSKLLSDIAIVPPRV
jgi:protoporphyrinogen/coproporphyrinogen III oxidase